MIKMVLQENPVIEVDFHSNLISLNCKDKNQLPTKYSQLAAK